MSSVSFRLGTRGSALAVAQSTMIADQLRRIGHRVELVIVRTEGDRTSGPLRLSGTGVFAAALREAILADEVDFAVHSFKDLPTAPVPGLMIAAVPRREDSRDVLCCREELTWATLPHGASVGTGSPRRVAQLLAARPDLDVVDIRGNVGTRLSRLEKDLDAVVLAAAGINRLGVSTNAEPFEPQVLLPAPAQGALALECRTDAAPELIAALRQIDDPPSRWCATAERAVLSRLRAGCSAPLGALATFTGGELRLVARFVAAKTIQATKRALVIDEPSAHQLGTEVAELLLAKGLPETVTANEPRRSLGLPLSGQHLLLPASVSDRMIEGLRDAGADVTLATLTETIFLPAKLPTGPFDWIVITSTMTLTALEQLGIPLPTLVSEQTKIAAVGPTTKAAIENLGLCVTLVPEAGNGKALVQEFPSGAGRVLVPGSALMNERLTIGLSGKGWEVTRIPVYTTTTATSAESSVLNDIETGRFTHLIGTAGSNIRAAAALYGIPEIPMVTIGEPSAKIAEDLGFRVVGVAKTPTALGLIDALT